MINRLLSHRVAHIITSVLGLASLAIFADSCSVTETLPASQDFATIRVINMALSDTVSGNVTVPLDVYIHPSGTPWTDSLAVINALAYGQASVYANNLSAQAAGTNYDLMATPLRDISKSYLRETHSVLPGHHYSWIIYTDPADPSKRVADWIEDAPASQAGDPTRNTFVRFINTDPKYPQLNLWVGDPVNGMKINSAPLDFRQSTPYVSLATKTKGDTSYTFFVTQGSDPTIIARLAFQSFGSGSFHTITFGGDPLRYSPHRTGNNALDSLRIRIFDDNNLGSDQTFPVPLSFRYNIINGVMATTSSNDPTDYVGYLINNEGDASHHGFTFDPTITFGIAADAVDTLDAANGIYESFLMNATLTDAVEIRGVRSNLAGENRAAIFDVRGAVDRKSILSDHPYSFVIFDTLENKIDTSSSQFKTNQMAMIPLPDQSLPNDAKLVIVNGLSYSSKAGAKTTNQLTATLNGRQIFSSYNQGRYYSFDTTGISGAASITLGGKVGNSVDAPAITFTMDPGGIYEAVLLGQKPSPTATHPMRWIVTRVNPIKH